MTDAGTARHRWLGLAVALALALATAVPWMLPGSGARRYPQRKLVRFWNVWTGHWKDVVDGICDRFNESQTEYEVVPLSIPGEDSDSKFLLAVAGGDPPDCITQWQTAIPSWAESRLLVPLDTLMPHAEWKRRERSIFPAVLRIGMFKGHLYGLPVGMDAFALYYRPDYFREAGLDPDKFPASLEELCVETAKMDRFDSSGNLIRVGMMPEGLWNYAPVFAGGFYDWATGSLTLDTPRNMRALDWITGQHQRLGFDRVTRFTASQNDTNGGQGAWPFMTGALAVTLDGQWRVDELKRLAPDFDYRTAPVPPPAGGLPRAGFCDGNFMVIPANARDVAGAWAFIQFWSGLSDPDRAAEFYTEGGWLPMDRQVMDAPVYQDYLRRNPRFRTFVDLMQSPNLFPLPPVPYQTYLADRVNRMEEAACGGGSTPQQAMRGLLLDLRRELKMRRDDGYSD